MKVHILHNYSRYGFALLLIASLASCGSGSNSGGGGTPITSSSSVSTSASSSSLVSTTSSSISSSTNSSLTSSSVSSQPTGTMVPFVLPWDDAAGGITNIGDALNHKPAGSLGSVSVSTDGHFSVGAGANMQRIRFLGVNITAESAFPTKPQAEKIAARLAKFGINLVRFHHMDNNWGVGSIIDYSAGNSRTLDTVNLDLLDYFINQLKLNGVYSNINLINSRQFMSADGLPAEIDQIEWKEGHIIGYIDSTQRNLEKEFATNLLNHINPYTNLRYSDDPAIAFVEINNENSMYQQFFDGAIDAWPALYQNNLKARWNTWLNNRYSNTSAAEAAWGAITETLGTEILSNNNFDSGILNWNLEQHTTAQAQTSTGMFSGRSGIAINITATGTASWNIQFNQAGLALTQGQLYTIHLWAKASDHDSFSLGIQQAYDPWGILEPYNFTVGNAWQEYTTSFIAQTTDNNLRINFGELGGKTGTFYLSDVSLKAGGTIGSLPDGESLENATISLNVSNLGYTTGRELDWMNFLRALENNYWQDMQAHIENTLDFNGLVTGSTIMNSPPSVQNTFPFIDAHAYWQHPTFPGVAWDPNNWSINNISMVNELDNTLHFLAHQRVAGKPFTVSEYQHPSPNDYSAEGPILAAAYGALHDWDGIYMFNYDANGDAGWDSGYVSNYFSMSQHPSKMANMMIAAYLFRRGDVTPSTTSTRINFSPTRELEILASQGRAWNVANGTHINSNTETVLTEAIALDVSSTPTGIEQPAAATGNSIISSNTGELIWDSQITDKSIVTIDTDQTKAIIGFIDNRIFTLGNIGIAIGTTELGWATVSLSLNAGSFATPNSASHMLIVVTGKNENTNMQWTNDTRTSVGNNWGEAPSLVERVPVTIGLPYQASRVSAWVLDVTGQRLSPLTVRSSGSISRLELSAATLWYEVEVTSN